MMFVRNDMARRRRRDLEGLAIRNDIDGRIELLCVDVSVNKEPWLIISIYKQPKVKLQHITKCIDCIMNTCVEGNVNIVFIGDTNVDMLKRNKLRDCLDINGLKNIIKTPTCFQGAPSLIDLFITNRHKRFKSCISVDTGLSDFHSMICFGSKFHVPKQKSTTITYRSYRHFDEVKFKYELPVAPFQVAEIFDDIDDALWLWYALTLDIVNVHAPFKTKTIKGFRVPYMNGELRRAINVKNMLKRKYNKSANNCSWEKYRKQRNIVTKLRKKSIKVYMQKQCADAKNSGGFWKAVKPLISHKNIIKDDNISLYYDGKVVSEPADVCRLFNDYYINVACNIGTVDEIDAYDTSESCISRHAKHPSITLIRTSMQETQPENMEFNFNTVNVQAIKDHLQCLNSKKATGYDKLPSRLLKVGSNTLCYSICHLVNVCISSCVFPSSLKCAEICPVYKKGDIMNVSNYRPVSILPNVSKIFEKELICQMTNYFDNLLSPYLSGFRKTHSCENVLIRMTESIKGALDNGQIVYCILMDLSNAFDCIPHMLLISKLRAYGLSLAACNLLTSYVRDRKQRVKLGSTKGEWRGISKGTAQGSIFGPFLFNVFLNDLILSLRDNVEIYNYADDNTLICTGYNYDDVKNDLLSNVNEAMAWFERNHMKVNSSKFQYIVFGNVDGPGTIAINDDIISPSQNVKLLGLYIDKKLNFNYHISQLYLKAGRQVHVLCRLSRVLRTSHKLLLYNSFISCYFNYCSIIWHFCSNVDTYKLERLQKKALRFTMLNFSCTYIELLNSCHKCTLYTMRLQKIVELVYRIMHGMCPSYLYDIVHRSDVNYLRLCHAMQIPKFKAITYGKKSLSYMAPVLWNSLTNNCKNSINVKTFRAGIRVWRGPTCGCGFCLQCRLNGV